MTGWKEDIFNNFIKLNRGFDLPEKDIIEGDYPVVASTSIKAYHKFHKVNPPAVVTGRSGSLGTVQYINKKSWPLNTSLYVKDFKGNHPKYVFYFLKTFHLENFNSGAGVPTLNQNHLHKLKIKIPPLPIQRKIAAILSSYDDLIENNNRRIAILEKMAEELYREWFVRLRFPGHEKTKISKGVPEGWDAVELNKIAKEVSKSTKPGIHLENRYYLPIELLQQRHFNPESYLSYEEAQSSLVTFQKGDILFGAMRPYLHKVCVAPFDGITRTTCFVIKPLDQCFYSYLYLLLFQNSSIEYANNICNGADRPYVVWNKAFERMFVFKPHETVVKKFNSIAYPLIRKVSESYFLLHALKTSRDHLLSRLMSGKIDVEHLDIAFPKSMINEADAELVEAPASMQEEATVNA